MEKQHLALLALPLLSKKNLLFKCQFGFSVSKSSTTTSVSMGVEVMSLLLSCHSSQQVSKLIFVEKGKL